MELDATSKAYIVAGLRIGQEIDGLVDAYYGPAKLEQATHTVARPWDAIETLQREIDDLPDGRRRQYFEAQLKSLSTVLSNHEGTEFDYPDEVQATYGIAPEFVDEAIFEQAHTNLELLLPGDGMLRERLERYRQQFTLPTEQIEPIAQRLTGALRSLTASMFELPDGESATIELVRDQPWSAYNWYLGNLQSRIEINTDLPVRAYELPDIVAHEIYCGHHTEGVLKEHLLYRRQGYGEPAITLLTSTQAIVSEGIATSAFELLVPGADQASWLNEFCYGPANIEINIEREREIATAIRTLRYVDGNAALLLHDQGQDENQVVDYISRWSLRDREQARQLLRFISAPLLRTYIFCYARGYDLVQAYLERAEDRSEAFWSLLTEHWTPQMLREASS